MEKYKINKWAKELTGSQKRTLEALDHFTIDGTKYTTCRDYHTDFFIIELDNSDNNE